MNMVIHQAISPDGKPESLRLLLQYFHINDFIPIAKENGLPSIPSLNYVMWYLWNNNSGDSGHKLSPPYTRRRRSHFSFTPPFLFLIFFQISVRKSGVQSFFKKIKFCVINANLGHYTYLN